MARELHSESKIRDVNLLRGKGGGGAGGGERGDRGRGWEGKEVEGHRKK